MDAVVRITIAARGRMVHWNEAKAALSKQNFAAMRKEQEANRGATNDVTEMTRQLGAKNIAIAGPIRRCLYKFVIKIKTQSFVFAVSERRCD